MPLFKGTYVDKGIISLTNFNLNGMKKITFSWKNKALAVFAVVSTFSFSAKADVIMTEHFEREVGDLTTGYVNPQGDEVGMPAGDTKDWWIITIHNYGNSLQVYDTTLTYPAYQTSEIGNAVKFNGNGNKYLRQLPKSVSSGKFYISFLIDVRQLPSSTAADYFFAAYENSTNVTAAQTYMQLKLGKVSETNVAENTYYKLGISKTNETVVYAPTYFTVNNDEETVVHLIVLEYEFVEGNNNDVVRLYIDPSQTNPQPSAVCDATKAATKTDAPSLGALLLRPSASATPSTILDAIKVATSWDDLWETAGGEEPEEPERTPAITSLSQSYWMPGVWGQVYVGETYSETFTVKAENLKDDITLSSDCDYITFSPAVISKEDAMSEQGATFTATITPTKVSEDYWGDDFTITLSSEGAEDKTIALYVTAIELVKVSTIAELRSHAKGEYSDEVITFEGSAVITKITDASNGQLYVQDATGALWLAYVTTVCDEFAVGDVVTKFTGNFMEDYFGLSQFEMGYETEFVISAHGQEVEPMVTTLAELQANPSKYALALVSLKDVTLPGEGQFVQGSLAISQNGTTASITVSEGVDYIGEDIPEKADIVGFSTNAYGTIIMPRSSADITNRIYRTPTSLNNVEALNIYAYSSNLVVNGATTTVEVLNVLGALVATAEPASHIQIPMEAGTYIVRTNNSVKKVVVK